MLDELAGQLEMGRPFSGQRQGNLQHVLAEESHPCRAVRLLEIPAVRQRRAAIKNTDVIQTEEAALKDIVAAAVLAIDPPGEVQKKLLERQLEPVDIAMAAPFLQAVSKDGGPCLYRRIYVTKIPLIGGKLT